MAPSLAGYKEPTLLSLVERSTNAHVSGVLRLRRGEDRTTQLTYLPARPSQQPSTRNQYLGSQSRLVQPEAEEVMDDQSTEYGVS